MPEIINRNNRIRQIAEKASEQAKQAAESQPEQSPVGQAVGAANTAMGVYGKIMGATGALSEKAMMPVMKALSFMQGLAVLPASSHMDPVMGIDVHFVMIPPSPSPIPMPHPYIAAVMDPKDWLSCAAMTVAAMAAPVPTGNADADAAASLAFTAATMALGMAGLSATVKLGTFTPRTTTGVKNKVIPHFPMGASFAPVPVMKNSGHAQFGSLFLVADSNPFTGLMHLNNDCWDVGIMQLFRRQYSPEPMNLFMPTGFIMAIPSHNVIVNPIPTPINPIAAFTKLLNLGFAKILHKLVNKLPLGNRLSGALHKAICHITGHPVDVISGMLFTDEEDFSLPGVIPFSWERTWYSDSIYKGPLGHGWYHNYDIGFYIDEFNRGIYRMNDGRLAVFELPAPGKFTFNRTEKLFLHNHKEAGYYYIKDTEGLIYRFTENMYQTPYHNKKERLLQSISNTSGYAIRFEYNRRGVLSGITDSAGRVLKVEHDLENHITRIIAPDPKTPGKTFVIAQYDYDEDGNMICHTDALDQQMLFEYQNHLLVKETWRNGQQWYFVFEGTGPGSRCIHTWGDGDLYNHKLTYGEGYTIVENSLGFTTTYYHKDGQLHKKTDANGADWLYRYNKYHDLEWETDPLGNQQSYVHDEWGNLVTTTDPGGGFTHTEYYHPEFPCLPTEAMDASGGKWQWTYDDAGRLTERINPVKAKTRYGYTDGLLSEIISVTNAVTRLRYDDQQNLIEIKTDDGAVTGYDYDALGNCVAITNPNGVQQQRAFDLKARVTAVKDFDGNHIRLEYDGIDNVTRYTDKQKDVQYTYRGLWKLTSRTESGATIFFKYDTEEQLYKIINEHGLPYKFELDPAGNVSEETGFDGIVRRYQRNAAGWVEEVARPGGKFTRYGYDKCGRVTEVLYSDGKKEVYGYRKDGELVVATNESATVLFERNVMGDIIKETVNDEWVASEYDIAGNRIRISSSPGADIRQQYNKMGDILQVSSGNWSAQFRHDILGLEVERLLPGGISARWNRDGIGRPVMQTVGHTSRGGINPMKRKQYTWDVNDRLKQIRDEKGITQFEHDGWSNLARTIYPNGEEQLRNPDVVGNLFATHDRKDRVYGKGGQLKKANGWEYAYDGEGNLISKSRNSSPSGDGGWLYNWNDAGMLTRVTRPDGVEVNFTYDALGRRLSKQFKNTITKFVWDGNIPLHEWKEHATTGKILGSLEVNEDGDLSIPPIPGPEHNNFSLSGRRGGAVTWLFDTDSFAPTAKIKNGKTYSIVTDHLGTPGQMYKEDGSLFWEMELDSYGKVRMEKGEAGSCPFRYQGQYEDAETGLYYNRFRYYSAEEGMYVSQDPIRMNGGARLYEYVTDVNSELDPWAFKTYRRKNGRFGKKPGPKNRKRELESLRRKAVRKAWREERRMVRETGVGTREWTRSERKELLETGRVTGYEGHHINNVEHHPSLAGDPNNIEFVTPAEHLDRHNGNFHNPSSGELFSR